jgi:hypothetical protein
MNWLVNGAMNRPVHGLRHRSRRWRRVRCGRHLSCCRCFGRGLSCGCGRRACLRTVDGCLVAGGECRSAEQVLLVEPQAEPSHGELHVDVLTGASPYRSPMLGSGTFGDVIAVEPVAGIYAITCGETVLVKGVAVIVEMCCEDMACRTSVQKSGDAADRKKTTC